MHKQQNLIRALGFVGFLASLSLCGCQTTPRHAAPQLHATLDHSFDHVVKAIEKSWSDITINSRDAEGPDQVAITNQVPGRRYTLTLQDPLSVFPYRYTEIQAVSLKTNKTDLTILSTVSLGPDPHQPQRPSEITHLLWSHRTETERIMLRQIVANLSK
jgi:hypothetical protein